MSAKFFLDTNILVYSFDASSPDKAQRSQSLVRSGDCWISWQVVQEFANVALHRFAKPLRPTDLAEYIEIVLWPHCKVLPSAALHRHALEIHSQTQYRFYDCLVVAAAIASGARTLYSEDLQHGREIAGLRIENPFLN